MRLLTDTYKLPTKQLTYNYPPVTIDLPMHLLTTTYLTTNQGTYLQLLTYL